MNKKKLKKLNMAKGKASFKKGADLVAALVTCAAGGAAMAAGTAAVSGVAGAIVGGDAWEAMLVSGGMAFDMSALGNAAVSNAKYNDKFHTFKEAGALFVSTLAASALSAGIGAAIGGGTHKLTTSIINKLQPEHQIERTAETEPAPVIDEIQVQNM